MEVFERRYTILKKVYFFFFKKGTIFEKGCIFSKGEYYSKKRDIYLKRAHLYLVHQKILNWFIWRPLEFRIFFGDQFNIHEAHRKC